MGFTTGFVGGLTLTYSLLYLTLHIHRQNRIYQSTLLTQQRTLLTHLYDPPSEIYDSPAYEVRRAGLTEQLKDGWNRELANVIRNLQEKDWQAARVKWEGRAEEVWRKLGGDEVVRDAKGKIVEVGEVARDKVVEVGEVVRDKAVEVSEVARDKAVEVKDGLVGAVTKDVRSEVKKVTGQKRLLEL